MSTGSMICPQCGKLISINEEKCPFCGAWRPGLYGLTPAMNRWFGGRLDVINIIVVACIVLYVASLALQPEAILQTGGGFFSFLSPGERALYQLGMTGGLAWRAGFWWTLLTAIYLHGGILHIFFNMMWVRNLGPAVTEAYGQARAFVIFSIAGAVGFLLSNLVSTSETLGASGSIFGLMAALIVYGRRVGHSALTRQIWQWAIIVFVMGFVMSSVNNWAHAGGFAGGWLASTFMRTSAEKREGRAAMVFGVLFALLTVAGVVLSFVQVTTLILSRP